MLNKLHFASLDDFEPDYKQVIQSELAELSSDHLWWNQAPTLDMEARPLDSLIGSCSLLRRVIAEPGAEPRKIDYRHDMLLAMADYLKCVEILTALSKEHEFAWELAQPGERATDLAGIAVPHRLVRPGQLHGADRKLAVERAADLVGHVAPAQR